jgi:hypothetical protein
MFGRNLLTPHRDKRGISGIVNMTVVSASQL